MGLLESCAEGCELGTCIVGAVFIAVKIAVKTVVKVTISGFDLHRSFAEDVNSSESYIAIFKYRK